jgi:superfamily I DNA/RNA helicase
MGMGLIEKSQRNGEEWLRVKFNQIDGPKPIFHAFDSRHDEIGAIAGHLKHLIQKEGISPTDICVIYNGRSVVQLLEAKLGPKMAEIGVELSVQTNRPFERQENTLVVTTSHSYKGYESEVVVIPCADQFVTGDGQTLANNLYVAMTRARSLLAIYGGSGGSEVSRTVCSTIAACVTTQRATPEVECEEQE